MFLAQNSNVTVAQVQKSKEYLNAMGQQTTVKGFNEQLLKLLTVCPRKVRYVTKLLAITKSDFWDIIGREENLIAA